MSKKKIIISMILILLFIIFIILFYFVLNDLYIKSLSNERNQSIYNFSNDNSETVFSINKIVFFSSANANASIIENSSFTVSNLYQFTDIAIFINNHSDNTNFTNKNTIKSLSLSNINFDSKPTIGRPNLYYKNLNDFSKNTFNETNLILNSLDFKISSKDKIDLNSPILYNNCANPITLCYVNSNLKNNSPLNQDSSNITYNGNLLKKCDITLDSLSCKLSFLITIVNNLDEIYTCPVIINIPLSTKNSTVYDGSLKIDNLVNYTFIKNKTKNF